MYSFTSRCRCRSPKIKKWSRHSRRRLPRKRSQIAFAFGARYGVFSTSIPVPLATRENTSPYLLSLSRIRNRGPSPNGVASQSRSLKTPIKAHSTHVRITHPAHPLRGQSFPAVQHQKQKNIHSIEIQLADGERRCIPLEWTDQALPTVTLPGGRFLLANLFLLRQRLDGLLQTVAESSILPPNDTRIEGGSNGFPEPVRMVETDKHSTCADHSHPGTDPAAPTSEATGG